MLKRNLFIGTVAGVLSLATPHLEAQGLDYRTPATQRSSDQSKTYSPSAAPAPTWSAEPNIQASRLIGLPVRSISGEDLGKVHDVVVNLRTQTVPYAIVEPGANLAGSARRVAVPLSAMRLSPGRREITLNGTKARFNAAASTPSGEWIRVAGRDWITRVDRFYGEPAPTSLSRSEFPELLGNAAEREPVRIPSDATAAGDRQPPSAPAHSAVMRNPNQITDEELMAKINRLVRWAQGGQPGNIQVALNKGVVTLSGVVPNNAQKKQLENQIKALPGVDRVEDHLITENQ